MEGESQDREPSPDSFCSACRSLTGEALLKTRASKPGARKVYYTPEGQLLEDHITPADPGVYYSILLTSPATSVKTCAACRLFHHSVHGGITLSEPTTLRVGMQKERGQLDVEDVGKVEKERERADQKASLDGMGRLCICADYGMHVCLDICTAL